jgi:sec-independent protein translocase protein TatB
MFDIGFPELMMVSIVALLVIGPDKLPQTIRTLVLWVGRFKRSLANIRADIESEIGADEIRQQLHNETVMKDLGATRQKLENIIHTTDKTLTDIKLAAANPGKATIDFATEALTGASVENSDRSPTVSSTSISNTADDASITTGPDSDKTRRPDAAE